YYHFKRNDNHCFMFLDNLKNMNLNAEEKSKVYKNDKDGYFTYYEVNAMSGEVSKKNLFNTEDLDHKFDIEDYSINRTLKVLDSEFILEVHKKKKEDVLIKVEIK
ncbi:MAG: hypothetical protein KBT69_06835, partial [Oceanihabitans sp.]|nr:hypothetical protein [Oceanihabitans sp.]